MEAAPRVLDARTPLDERMLTLKQRSLLAHTAAGDLILWDAQEQLLRAVSECDGAGARIRAWRPQIVSAALLHAHPSFLAEPADRQQVILAAHAPNDGEYALDGMPFQVFELVLSKDGAMAALVGLSHVAVVALHLLSDGGGSGGEAASDALPCYAVLVGDAANAIFGPVAGAGKGKRDGSLKQAGDGLLLDAIVSARWHPLSSTHLVLLRASGSLSMTDVCADASKAELELAVCAAAAANADAQADAAGDQRQLGAGAREQEPRASALALGEGCGAGWASVTAYVATEAGSIFAICPLVPRSAGARWHVMKMARQVRAGANATQRLWLRAFAQELASGASSRGGADHDDDGAAASRARPAVQGPMRVRGGGGAAGAADEEGGSGEGALGGGDGSAPTGALLLVPSERAPHLLARARLDGSVELLLVSGPAEGRWEEEDQEDQRDGSGHGAGGRWGGTGREEAPRLELLSMQLVHIAWPKAVLRAFGGSGATSHVGDGAGAAGRDGWDRDGIGDRDGIEDELGDEFGALGLGAPALQKLEGQRAWISLLADPALPDQLTVRESNGCHVLHVPWLGAFQRFLGGPTAPGLAGEAEPAEAGETVPDCPPALGFTRALLPSEAALLSAAAARTGGGRRARAAFARARLEPEEEGGEEEEAAELPFRLLPGSSAGSRLEVRPQLLGVCSSGSHLPISAFHSRLPSGCVPSGSAGSAGSAGGLSGPLLYALCADGTVRATDLSAAPPAPPPPGADDGHEAGGAGGAAGQQPDGDVGGARDGGARNSERGEGTGAHAARLRALTRAASQGTAALAQKGGLEAAVGRSLTFSEEGLAQFERAAATLKHTGALPALELGAHAKGRLEALAGGMAADALSEVQALMAATQARSLLLEAKARFASAYQRNLSARTAALHAILARTCQPPLSAQASRAPPSRAVRRWPSCRAG